ncbi:hypothetical protein B0H67DRAFT_640078 [Lasiosphaeris hirsuta]|uniref:Extracellular globin n=1 Tax=Lasiosphaeris hirsuta TaxID=260670 RepID=A0AA40BCK7_9PEZI|nr:hypothetical protein B0H67DRAFT_640078 [Lasiosphaeris hirsuta]
MSLSRTSTILFIALFLAAAAEAYNVTTTSCSTPNATANFVTSPNVRGTLDILWSSLFTIIACTWSVQHPNVPEQLINPWHDLENARRIHESASFQKCAHQDGVEWTFLHSYFANMGGFVIQGDPSDDMIHHPYHLDADTLLRLCELNILKSMRDISTEDILDKPKDDWLVKGAAICQIQWTTIQIAVRLANKIDVSPARDCSLGLFCVAP